MTSQNPNAVALNGPASEPSGSLPRDRSNQPLISICIPTRNRADCLAVLLHSIVAQNEPGIQVVISDDASEDHTGQVVAAFRDRLPNILYERAGVPLRYDRNVLHVVAMATGTFCWLFGDDDRMEPGALASVSEALRIAPTLTGLTTGRISYDHKLAETIPVRDLKQNQTTLFSNAGEACLQLLDRLGFLSCQVINRERWQMIATENLSPYFAGYVQLYIIVRMIQAAPHWEFLADKCVGFRSDNDSFRILGMFGRLRMDVCGYEQIIGDVFGRHSEVYRQAMGEVATTHARHHIITAKRASAPFSFFVEATALCIRYYWRYPGFWLKTFPVLMMPRFLALALRGVYQRLRSRRKT